MAGLSGRTLRGVGRRKIRMRRQPMGRRRVRRLSKSNHITDLSLGLFRQSHTLQKRVEFVVGIKARAGTCKGLWSAKEDSLLDWLSQMTLGHSSALSAGLSLNIGRRSHI